jgi:hypothetical protein
MLLDRLRQIDQIGFTKTTPRVARVRGDAIDRNSCGPARVGLPVREPDCSHHRSGRQDPAQGACQEVVRSSVRSSVANTMMHRGGFGNHFGDYAPRLLSLRNDR